MQSQDTSGERSFIEKTVDERSTEWGQQLQSTSESLRQTANLLRGFSLRGPAQIVDSIGEYARSVGSYLETSDTSQFLRDLESIARRQPMIVVGASLVAGALGARVLKATRAAAAREQYVHEQTMTVGEEDVSGIDARDFAARAIEEPLGPALIASALGFVIALLIPMTDGEMDRWSSMNERLPASEVMERGQRILEETKRAAAHVAREQADEVAQKLISS